MTTKELLKLLKRDIENVHFTDVIATIDNEYNYSPTAFTNGIGDNEVTNDAGTNEGSCKIFGFAKLNQLSKEQTLNCFGDYYRVDVLQNPEATDHANIRSFMNSGWAGIQFDDEPLTYK